MPKFKRPTDTEIKERAAKRQYLNYGQYTLQGLEIISEQVDQLSKQFDQILSLGVAENPQKIRKSMAP